MEEIKVQSLSLSRVADDPPTAPPRTFSSEDRLPSENCPGRGDCG